MCTIHLEETGYTKYLAGDYSEGELTYEVTVCEYHDTNAAHTWHELVNVQLNGQDIDDSDPVWNRINQQLRAI